MKRSARDAGGPTKRTTFEARRLLKVYLDAKDLERLTGRAREAGALVGEYVRSLVLDDLESLDALEAAEDAAAAKPQPIRVSREMLRDDAVPSPMARTRGACCPHGHERGEVCYKCDPKFGYPALP